jgi:hypothetical protein
MRRLKGRQQQYAARHAADAQCAPLLRAPGRPSCLLLVLLAALAAAPTAAAAPVPIDSSVVLLFTSDVDGGAGSLCAQMTRRAMAAGGRMVNYVVTGCVRNGPGDGKRQSIAHERCRRAVSKLCRTSHAQATAAPVWMAVALGTASSTLVLG